jgi:hypothetical protein
MLQLFECYTPLNLTTRRQVLAPILELGRGVRRNDWPYPALIPVSRRSAEIR